jgi:hypothetical protein
MGDVHDAQGKLCPVFLRHLDRCFDGMHRMFTTVYRAKDFPRHDVLPSLSPAFLPAR